MYILGNLIIGLAQVLDSLLFIANIVVIASVIISWVNADPYNPIVSFIHKVTAPVYSAVRKKVPTTYNGMDFTAIVVLLVILFIQSGIIPSIMQIGISMKM